MKFTNLVSYRTPPLHNYVSYKTNTVKFIIIMCKNIYMNTIICVHKHINRLLLTWKNSIALHQILYSLVTYWFCINLRTSGRSLWTALSSEDKGDINEIEVRYSCPHRYGARAIKWHRVVNLWISMQTNWRTKMNPNTTRNIKPWTKKSISILIDRFLARNNWSV